MINKTVAQTWQRLDIAWFIGGIAERSPKLFNRIVESVFEINESIGRPELLLDFVPSHNLSGAVQQQLDSRRFDLLKPMSPVDAKGLGQSLDATTLVSGRVFIAGDGIGLR